MGMGGAHRGVGTSNDTLYLNPAGMAVATRYGVETAYQYSNFSDLTDLNLSAVDSKSGPVAGGFGYTHTRGDADGVAPSLQRYSAALAYPLMPGLAFGVSTKHVRGEYKDAAGDRQEVELTTGDAGISLLMAQGLGFGVTMQNTVKTDHPLFTPRIYGAGVSFQNPGFVVAADISMNQDTEDKFKTRYNVGAEYFLMGLYPIRLGYRREPTTKKDGSFLEENIFSVGGGWMSQSGSFEFAAEHSLERMRNWKMIAAMKFFL